PQDVPAVRQKARRDVLRKGDPCFTLDGDVVVVVDPAKVVEAQVSGQRRGLHLLTSHFSAMPIPTLVATPCPSGPVVVSTPETQWYSGCPGALLSSWRKWRMSSRETEGGPTFYE